MNIFLRKISCISLLLLLFFASTAYANPAEEAEAFLKKEINALLSILQTPEWRTPSGQKKLYPQVRTLIRNMLDFNAMSAQIVGPKWRTFSKEEQNEFSSAISNLMEYNYSSSFKSYTNQTLVFEKKRANSSGTQVEITIALVNADGKKTMMVYRLRKVGTSWKIYNVIVENINLIVSYRTQISELLSKSSPQDVIKILQEQAKNIASKKPTNS